MAERSLTRLLGLAVLALALGGLAAMMMGIAATPREGLLRFVVGALIVLAVAPAHVLLPDPQVPWLQRLNPPPARLLGRAAGRWAGVVLAAVVPVVVIAVRTAAWMPGLEAALLLLGTGLYALQNTVALGPVSQEWQEGRRGRLYRELVAREPRASFQVPHGMVPAMLASLRIFGIGFAFTLLTLLALATLGPGTAWSGGLALTAWSTWRLARLTGAFDRAYYHTSALYQELLHSPALRHSQRPDLTYEATYWVPRRWRAHAWAGLVQLDRRLPLGRLVALGVLGFWSLLILDAGGHVLALYLGIALMARNASILRHSQADVAPPQLHLALQPTFEWGITRFWMNVRWTLPVMLALAVAAWLSARFSWADALLWTAIDLVLAAAMALVATLAAEHRYRRRFA